MLNIKYQDHSREETKFGVFHYKYAFANNKYNGFELILFGHGICIGNEVKSK